MPHVDEGALHAYLDGEATAAERAELEAHLAGCATCRTRLGDERALLQRAGELLGRALPPESLRSRRTSRRWIVPLTWAATVVLAVGLGYALRGSDGTPPVDQIAMSSDAIAPPTPPGPAAPAAPSEEQAAARRDAPVPAPVPTSVALDAGRGGAGDTATANVAARIVAPQEQAPTLRAASPRDAARVAAPPAVAAAPAAALSAGEARAERSLSALRGRLVATEWPVIQRNAARDVLGADPVGVPGLAVRQVRRSPENDGTILIEQAVDASTVIQLYQRRTAAGLEREVDRYGNTERLARFVDGLRVEIAGPLSQDSLNRLLEQVKPLP